MGVLKHADGRMFPLGARVVVGRSSASLLRIRSRQVSNEHAVLYWSDGAWWVKDLGSRNGTRVGTRDLAPGLAVKLGSGEHVTFAEPAHTWQLVSAEGPVALAIGPDGGIVQASDGLLALPDAESPRATVYATADGWWLETDDAGHAVADGASVVVGGRAYTLFLPADHEQTWAAEAERLALAEVTLQFRVSRDEEVVELDVSSGAAAKSLGARADHYLLLTLARAHRDDADVDPAERGWRHAEDLARGLRIDRPLLNLQVFRARKRLAKAGVVGAAGVVERRAASSTLRLGDCRYTITVL